MHQGCETRRPVPSAVHLARVTYGSPTPSHVTEDSHRKACHSQKCATYLHRACETRRPVPSAAHLARIPHGSLMPSHVPKDLHRDACHSAGVRIIHALSVRDETPCAICWRSSYGGPDTIAGHQRHAQKIMPPQRGAQQTCTDRARPHDMCNLLSTLQRIVWEPDEIACAKTHAQISMPLKRSGQHTCTEQNAMCTCMLLVW